MSGHTKEPWPSFECFDRETVVLNEADYRRARVCVNACAGIATEMLETMATDPLGGERYWVRALADVSQERDRMLGALRLALAALEANSDEVPHGFGGEIEAVRSAIGDRLTEALVEPESAIYSYSIDGEMFHGAFVSPEAAAADGLLSNPDAPAIEVAECVRRPASAFVRGEFVVEDAQERAFDSCGEAAEDWLNGVVVDRAAMDELERHVGDWLQARDPVMFFEVINVRTITRAELIASGHLEADD